MRPFRQASGETGHHRLAPCPARRARLDPSLRAPGLVSLANRFYRPHACPHQIAPQVEAEFLPQVVDSRAEVAAIAVITNLPFSKGTSVLPEPRLCKVIVDWITFRDRHGVPKRTGHII